MTVAGIGDESASSRRGKSGGGPPLLGAVDEPVKPGGEEGAVVVLWQAVEDGGGGERVLVGDREDFLRRAAFAHDFPGNRNIRRGEVGIADEFERIGSGRFT